ncbi:MAG: hypothetical protein R2795_05270 [Saprospiraceae bacterium]
MKRLPLYFLLLCSVYGLYGQTLRLSLPQVVVAEGASVILPVTVSDFDSIVSLQLSVNWEVEVAVYDNHTLGALPLLAVGDFQAANGELRFSWFDNTGAGQSLPDGTVIANLQFTAVGLPGATTALPFTGQPLAIQIFKATSVPGQFEPVALAQDEGRITIESPLGFTAIATDVTCYEANDGTITTQITANPTAYTFRWSGPDGFESQASSLMGLSPGTYFLEILDTDGNIVFTWEQTIASPTAPLAVMEVAVTPTDCTAPTGSISLTAVGGTPPYAYSLAGSVSPTGTFTAVAAGTYDWVVADANACTVAGTATVVAPEAPAISLPDTLSLCGETALLSPGGEGVFNWSTGASSPEIEVTEAGLYTVTVTNENDCQSTASTWVVQGTPPVAS